MSRQPFHHAPMQRAQQRYSPVILVTKESPVLFDFVTQRLEKGNLFGRWSPTTTIVGRKFSGFPRLKQVEQLVREPVWDQVVDYKRGGKQRGEKMKRDPPGFEHLEDVLVELDSVTHMLR